MGLQMIQQMMFWMIDLLIPSGMVAEGMAWRGIVPRRPCAGRGYCTPRSMRSSRAWRYAQRCFSDLCVRFGSALILLVSADRAINMMAQLMPSDRLSYLNAGVAVFLFLSIVPLVELNLSSRFGKEQPSWCTCPQHN